MKYYTVKISETALSDMENIYNYIAEKLQAPETAMRQYNRIADAIESLNCLPSRIRSIECEEGFISELRQLLVDNFSIFFVIKENYVVITNVLYSSCDIENRLKNLLTNDY